MPCLRHRCAMPSRRAELKDDRPPRRNVDRPVGIKLMSHRVASVPSEKPKIRCRGFVKSLSAWHDGELAEGTRASFETHLGLCSQCARYASDFGTAIALLKSALADLEGHTEFPEDLARKIFAACRETN
jgi:anti-sigma factor RsiW